MKRSGLLLAAIVAFVGIGAVARAGTTVNLGTAESFAVLGSSTVTNTGPSVIVGDLGVSPGSAITGFPPGIVTGGAIYVGGPAATAQADATTAYNYLAGRPVDTNLTGLDLGGMTLAPGVYKFNTSAQLTGTLHLTGPGVYVFQIGSTLTTGTGAQLVLAGGATASNVYFQVSSSATLGTGTSFAGTIIALASVSLVTGSSLDGRAIGLNGAVTLDNNKVSVPTATPPATQALTLAPLNSTNPVDTNHMVTATALLNAAPAPGVTVNFSVTAGPHAGANGSAATNVNGIATWSYPGTILGTDTIQATATIGAVPQTSNDAYKTWETATPPLTLAPLTATNPTGTNHTVTATATLDGEPAEGVTVNFSILVGPNAGASGSAVTIADGTATWSYSGATAGIDTIQATATIGAVLQTSNLAYKTWEAPSLSPRALKERAAGTLAALLPTGDKKLDKKLAVALDEVQDSLRLPLWADDYHLTLVGKLVFTEEYTAVQVLAKLLANPSLDPTLAAALQSAINDLVATDDILALTALAEAIAGADPGKTAQKEVATAGKDYNKGLAIAAAGGNKVHNAISAFKDSWVHSQKALGRKPK